MLGGGPEKETITAIQTHPLAGRAAKMGLSLFNSSLLSPKGRDIHLQQPPLSFQSFEPAAVSLDCYLAYCLKGMASQVRTSQHVFRPTSKMFGTSLVVQRLRICASIAGGTAPSLVRELRSCMPHGVAKKERNDTVWVNVEVDVQSEDWFLLAQAWPPPLSAEAIAVLTPWLGNLSCGVLFHSGPSQEIRNQLSLLPGPTPSFLGLVRGSCLLHR